MAVAIGAIFHEPMPELGAMLKWSSSFLTTYVLFTARECLGYFPTVNQFHWGGYELTSTIFARGAGKLLVRGILEAAHQLIRDQPLRIPPIGSPPETGSPR